MCLDDGLRILTAKDATAMLGEMLGDHATTVVLDGAEYVLSYPTAHRPQALQLLNYFVLVAVSECRPNLTHVCHIRLTLQVMKKISEALAQNSRKRPREGTVPALPSSKRPHA